MSPDVEPIIRCLYGSFPDKVTEKVDWVNMEKEAQQSGNNLSPMVETDEESWHKCLEITLAVFEEKLRVKAEAKAKAAEAEAKAAEAEARAKAEAKAKAKAGAKAKAKAGAAAAAKNKLPAPSAVSGSTKRPAVGFSSGPRL